MGDIFTTVSSGITYRTYTPAACCGAVNYGDRQAIVLHTFRAYFVTVRVCGGGRSVRVFLIVASRQPAQCFLSATSALLHCCNSRTVGQSEIPTKRTSWLFGPAVSLSSPTWVYGHELLYDSAECGNTAPTFAKFSSYFSTCSHAFKWFFISGGGWAGRGLPWIWNCISNVLSISCPYKAVGFY